MTKRVLHVVGIMDCAGQETFIMNIYRNINREKVLFDFLVHTDKEGFFDREILELGGIIHKIPVIKNSKFRVLIRMLDNYKFYLKHPEYKTIHIHASNAKCVLEMIPAKLAGVKNIIVHSHSSSSSQQNIHKLFRPILKYMATNYFACSESASKWMFDKKILNSGKLLIIKNAIDLSKFTYNEKIRDDIRERYGIDSKFVIGHIGRFHKQKNHEFLIEVFKEVNNLYSNSVLLLVGDGSVKEEIIAKVSNLNLDENVIFMGIREDISDLLQAFDIFLFPSLNEGLGIVAIESQAASLKTFVSDGVPAEVKITDYVEFISLKKSALEWAEQITKYTGGYVRQKNNKSILEAGYDIKGNAEYLEKIYLNLQDSGRKIL
ncbi:glycosyltransferase [Bacillus sp. CRN 9]|nr:glycosyltransferase [Bacillus sp. CRN 9]